MSTVALTSEVVYTTPCGMYRVLKSQDGCFYPQEQIFSVAGFGRLRTIQEVENFRDTPHTIQQTPFEGWYLGCDCRGKSKGYKNFKTEKAARNFVDRQSEGLQGL